MNKKKYITPKLVIYLTSCAVLGFATYMNNNQEINTKFKKNLEFFTEKIIESSNKFITEYGKGCEATFPVVCPACANVMAAEMYSKKLNEVKKLK